MFWLVLGAFLANLLVIISSIVGRFFIFWGFTY